PNSLQELRAEALGSREVRPPRLRRKATALEAPTESLNNRLGFVNRTPASDHGPILDDGELGDDDDPVADDVVGGLLGIDDAGLVDDPDVPTDPGVFVDDGILDLRAGADADVGAVGPAVGLDLLGRLEAVGPHDVGVPDRHVLGDLGPDADDRVLD